MNTRTKRFIDLIKCAMHTHTAGDGDANWFGFFRLFFSSLYGIRACQKDLVWWFRILNLNMKNCDLMSNTLFSINAIFIFDKATKIRFNMALEGPIYFRSSFNELPFHFDKFLILYFSLTGWSGLKHKFKLQAYHFRWHKNIRNE